MKDAKFLLSSAVTIYNSFTLSNRRHITNDILFTENS